MKFNIAIITIVLFSVQTSFAQFKIPQVLKEAANSVKPGSPDQLEIGSALKEALELGIAAGTDRLSTENGFLGNTMIKLMFPQEAKKAEKTLRALGLNKTCDDFILSLNRAAELAAKEAKPIFFSALKQMTVQDASSILLSDNNDAATTYFKLVTASALLSKFKPVIQASLAKTNATAYWTDLSSKYNQIPMVSKVNTDLSDYATQKAIEGLFHEIAQEELKIRQNPDLRSSPLLKKVFGYADKNRNGITIR